MPVSAVDTITLAIEHTKQQLFKPFRVGQWTRLAIVGLLAGELGTSGSCNRSNLHLPTHPGVQAHGMFPGFAGVDPALVAAIIAVLIVTGLLLVITLMYVSSVMRFVLFDSIIAKECHIGRGWSLRQRPGWRYFLWKLLYLCITFAAIVGLAILAGIPAAFAFAAGWFKEPGAHLVPLCWAASFLFLVLLIFFLAISVIFVLTKDFVVPQMALENIGAVEGWRRLWPMIKAEMSGYAIYIAMKILMAIGAGIAVGIATLILGLFLAVPTIGLGIIAVLTGKTAGLTWNAYTITLAVVVGSVLLAIFMYLIALISVPVVVFFPAYSIYFFAARYPPLHAVLYPSAPPALGTLAGSTAFPQQPPPLPPAPEPAG